MDMKYEELVGVVCERICVMGVVCWSMGAICERGQWVQSVRGVNGCGL
jgi:hypothetical protein